MSTTPSGWYPNPHNAAEELYWDGSRWLGASRIRIVELAAASRPTPRKDATAAGNVDDIGVTVRFGDDPNGYGRENTHGGESRESNGDPNGDTVPLADLGLSVLYSQVPYSQPPYLQPTYLQPTQADGSQRAGALGSNGYALASLLLGVGGIVLTVVPFMIGIVAGGIPDLLAIVFGVLGLVHGRGNGGDGTAHAIAGTVLGAFGLCLIPLGAGWLW